MQAIGDIGGRAKAAGKHAAIFVAEPRLAGRYREMGYTFIALGNEATYYRLGVKALLESMPAGAPRSLSLKRLAVSRAGGFSKWESVPEFRCPTIRGKTGLSASISQSRCCARHMSALPSTASPTSRHWRSWMPSAWRCLIGHSMLWSRNL